MNKTESRFVRDFESEIPTPKASFKEVAAKSNINSETKRISNKSLNFLGLSFVVVASIVLAIVIPTSLSNKGQSQNHNIHISYRFAVGIYHCTSETIFKENTKFTFSNSFLKIEESKATPAIGQIATPGENLLNSGLLITFGECINGSVMYGEIEEDFPYIYDSLTYGFEFDNKVYKINIRNHPEEPLKKIALSIYEPSEGDKYGNHDYVIDCVFSLVAGSK